MKGRDNDDLPPLPKELAEGIQSLRRAKPPEALVERAFAALPPTPPRPQSKRASQPRPRLTWAALALAPALATAAIALHLAEDAVHDASAAIERSEERSVDLPEEGHAWTDISLETHHHADKPAVVHVDVPENVRVSLPAGHGGEQELHCTEERCVHRFTHRPGAPLRVAVAHPGRYEIHVRHESKEARVRERFVLTALRD
ncbi:hypothetical protein [Polyangium aurulentum]|uniref:hypothetical protein n=1 Tax=Polyangium aurulentum TaxID=2567896 RepID=UPI0010AE2FEA|nr:hypothetical protein [Polyangium aurulentum]UQA61912.1 hypothetical protein E8A73_016150 [Polyangium aurulentum]